MQMHSGGAIRFSGKGTDSQIKMPPLGGIFSRNDKLLWNLTALQQAMGFWDGMGKGSARFADKGMSQSRLGSLRLVPSRSMI